MIYSQSLFSRSENGILMNKIDRFKKASKVWPKYLKEINYDNFRANAAKKNGYNALSIDVFIK